MATPSRGELLNVLPEDWGYDTKFDEYIDPNGNRVSGYMLRKLIAVPDSKDIPMLHVEPSKFGSRVANRRVELVPIVEREREPEVPSPGRVVRIKWNWEPQRKMWADICERDGRQPEERIEAPVQTLSPHGLTPKQRAILRSLSG